MKYDIHTRPPQPSDETIAKHQDFDALFAQFTQQNNPDSQPATPKKKPANLSYWIAPLAAAAATLGWYLYNPTTTTNPNTEAPLALQAPLPNIQKAFTSYQLPSDKDTLIQHPSGSKINIPAAAFVDKNGQPVKGKVDIQYREMHDHVDMFIAGVPQVANHHNTAQTAAALQIQGYQNGEPVYINQDKPLQVELHTHTPADLPTQDLAIYAYQPKDSNWYFQQADKIERLSSQNTNPTPIQEPQTDSKAAYLAQLEQQYPAPKAPSRRNSTTDDRETFDIDFNPTQFPEFAQFKDLLWAVSDNKKTYQSVLTQQEWETMSIQHGDNNQYILVLTSEKQTISVPVEPVASNPQDAEKIYQQQLAAYNKAAEQRQTKIRNLLAQWKAPSNIDQTEPDTVATQTIVHRFKVNKFGLWAAAFPQPNLAKTTNPQFVDASETPTAKIKTLFAANPNQRIYFSIPNPQSNQPLPIADAPLLWAVDDQNQLRTIQKSKTNPNQYQILPPNPNAYATENELRLYLNTSEIN